MLENFLSVLRFIFEIAFYCGITFVIFWIFWRTTIFIGRINEALKDIEYLKGKSSKARNDIEKLKHIVEKNDDNLNY